MRIPCGIIDYSLVSVRPPTAEVVGDGNAKTLATSVHNDRHFVARTIRDPRTLNKKVFTLSDELSKNDIFAIVERLTGKLI
jgi:hypothetical protein